MGCNLEARATAAARLLSVVSHTATATATATATTREKVGRHRLQRTPSRSWSTSIALQHLALIIDRPSAGHYQLTSGKTRDSRSFQDRHRWSKARQRPHQQPFNLIHSSDPHRHLNRNHHISHAAPHANRALLPLHHRSRVSPQERHHRLGPPFQPKPLHPAHAPPSTPPTCPLLQLFPC